MDSEKEHLGIIELVKETDFDDQISKGLLQDKLNELRSDDAAERDSQLYAAFFHHLAKFKNQVFFEKFGLPFCSWLLSTAPEEFQTQIGDPGYPESRNPVHSAIDNENDFFLDCLIEASNVPGCEIKDVLANDRKDGKNCLHAVMDKLLPCAGDIVAKCSRTTILALDHDLNTPLHIAMGKGSASRTFKLNMLRSTDVVETYTKANMSKARSLNHNAPSVEDKSSFVSPGSHIDNTGRRFDPAVVYRQIKKHILKDSMPTEDKSAFMTELLAVVNAAGKSPYQILIERVNSTKQNRTMAKQIEQVAADLSRSSEASLLQRPADEKKKMGLDTAKPEEIPVHEEMKDDIFTHLIDVEIVNKALYGTDGPEKELFLDMSDFSNPSHDFKGFIAGLTADLPETPKLTSKGPTQQAKNSQQLKIIPNARAAQVLAEKMSIEFENILFYVNLPDLNNFKDTPHDEVRRLFQWLAYREVKTIRSLCIPDNNVAPMSDVLIEGAIINKFEIEKFDWRKLDINLEILTKSHYSGKFTELKLYSSGNWSVLHHWVSDEGLVTLGKLQKVTIIIVQLDPKNDQEAHDSYKDRVELYETKLREKLQKIKDNRPGFDFEVKPEGRWNFPVARYDQKPEPFVPNLKLVEQLQNCHSFLKSLRSPQNSISIPSNLRKDYGLIKSRLEKFSKNPATNKPDLRIKVAVIDNGADKIRNSVGDMIAKGVSYVTAGAENGDRILPWWMVADPHGTQMASLITNANPFCRLYIARVGKGRKDILPENAAKAVRWAIQQKVDVISISWVTKKDHPALKKAIAEATDGTQHSRPILVFCSTADEGIYSGPVYPAAYDNTVRVAATDKYGHLQPGSDGDVNILVPGQDIDADGPSYMEKYVTGTVSGSSVATASAAGIASLALLMLKTFNKEDEKLWKFYKQDGMMKVFEKMHDKLHGGKEVTGIELSDLFPAPAEMELGGGEKQSDKQSQSLHKAWQFDNFLV